MMFEHLTRRELLMSGFVLAAGAGLCGLGAAPAEAQESSGGGRRSRLKLSCCAYSYREQLTGKDAANPMTLDDYLRISADCGCDGVEPTAYYFPDPLPDAFLAEFKAKAHRMGLDISGTAIRTDYCVPAGPKREEMVRHTKLWIDRALLMGAPCIRVFAGGDAKGDIPAQRRLCVETVRECLDYAAEKGIILAVENHGGIVHDAENLLALVEEVASPWFAVTLDSGNFRTPDPYADIARCVPYAVTVQYKTEVMPGGGPKVPADLKRVIGILREGGYSGYLALEYEAAEPAPVAVPRVLREMRRAIDETQ